MASSSLFDLVNSVLRLTGDLNDLTDSGGTTDVANAAGGIGKRITEMLNLVITKLDKEGNWPLLRVDSAATTDGINDQYVFVGSSDLRAGGIVSVWVDTIGRLEEVTASQFDNLRAQGGADLGVPKYFQRQLTVDNEMQVQIYPLPASGYTLRVSGFSKGTKFTQPPVDTETTEYDDDLLITGTLMHIDLYDGIPRGYDSLFKDALATAKLELMGNKQLRIETDDYR